MQKLDIRTVLALMSIIIVVVGIGGMFYCLPFLYSGRIEDLLGAGFPFLAGAVLVAGGLISLSLVVSNRIKD